MEANDPQDLGYSHPIARGGGGVKHLIALASIMLAMPAPAIAVDFPQDLACELLRTSHLRVPNMDAIRPSLNSWMKMDREGRNRMLSVMANCAGAMLEQGDEATILIQIVH